MANERYIVKMAIVKLTSTFDANGYYKQYIGVKLSIVSGLSNSCNHSVCN